jgi:uncharacterized protein
VSVVYVDTSALGRVLQSESDAPRITRELAAHGERLSSRLLAVELRRLALRTGRRGAAERLLSDIALLAVDEDTLSVAERIEPSSVATLDAIHLATAVRLATDGKLDAILTYDVRLAEGARHHGIAVVAPT